MSISTQRRLRTPTIMLPLCSFVKAIFFIAFSASPDPISLVLSSNTTGVYRSFSLAPWTPQLPTSLLLLLTTSTRMTMGPKRGSSRANP
ncbi:hypothetical protein GmHk_01G001145 [Glycine max]|uniref:Uncharacterized protein n=1 Tax=Glycine soja TaxID=3848 RepID=A0A0B2QS73_GLYSO|nr:hypothetical protein JHK85_001041 [Glycine max]KAG5088398.1 hypothetical protein JHK86_001010 [Glycine max]KAH1265443.1 hypothetical protein GmHk_01G001145 [Glycine max]KHN24225.1 hypothetical protein glysoja_037059 [Glycine soja]